MIILKHNTLKASDLFIIERLMLKIASEPYQELLDYSLLNKPRSEVYGYMGGIFKRIGICQILGITTSEFLDLLIDIEKSYLDNPYHSFYHGCDTAMVLYHMIEHYHMAAYLTKLDIIILMLAALCHDAGHPGNNNQFEVNCKTERALKYNNLSVLESQSASIALELLDKHQMLRHLKDDETINDFRSSMVTMILATDMICHFTLKENIDYLYHVILHRKKHCCDILLKPLFHEQNPYSYFERLLTTTTTTTTTKKTITNSKETALNKEERQMMCNILLHAADISNPCRPWPVFHQLSRLVCVEFFRQGQQEQQRGLPISPNMDQSKAHPSKINVGFIDFVVHPYFESLARLFPKLSVFVNHCVQNRQEWLNLASETVETEGLPSIQATLERQVTHITIAAGSIQIPTHIEKAIRSSHKRKRSLQSQQTIVTTAPNKRRKSEGVIQLRQRVDKLRRKSCDESNLLLKASKQHILM